MLGETNVCVERNCHLKGKEKEIDLVNSLMCVALFREVWKTSFSDVVERESFAGLDIRRNGSAQGCSVCTGCIVAFHYQLVIVDGRNRGNLLRLLLFACLLPGSY